jgi:hypothetical protein
MANRQSLKEILSLTFVSRPKRSLRSMCSCSGWIVGKQEVIGYFLFARYSGAIPRHIGTAALVGHFREAQTLRQGEFPHCVSITQ